MPLSLTSGRFVPDNKWIKPWIGVDLDRTLAKYDKFISPNHIGEPIPEMVERVKKVLAEGKYEVKIFTARVAPKSLKSEEELEVIVTAISKWSLKHLGQILDITATKDVGCIEIWDDRAKQVEPNTGIFSSEVYHKAGFQSGVTKGYDTGYYAGYYDGENKNK